MARKFDIPISYRSSLLSKIKEERKKKDRYKKDFSPTIIDLGKISFKVARYFGFCFGVENAIEIAYRTIEENPNTNIFLLSEMIHNFHVNQDLQKKGIRFIQKTDETPLIPFSKINKGDIVIIPAFGTTTEMFEKLKKIGVRFEKYNTTCPFVERVWNRSQKLGKQGYTVVIHGHDKHEETRATFSHAQKYANTIVIRNQEEAKLLKEFICKERDTKEFYKYFEGCFSKGFDPNVHLSKIGVVNQTTMLAEETQSICDYLKKVMDAYCVEGDSQKYFANTQDTLCYATTENQLATKNLLEEKGDIAIIIGSYNSSNTSHLFEVLANRVPSFFIQDAKEILSQNEIRHWNPQKKEIEIARSWLPQKEKLEILITAGASCPDIFVEKVIEHISNLQGLRKEYEMFIEADTF